MPIVILPILEDFIIQSLAEIINMVDLFFQLGQQGLVDVHD